MFNPDSQFKYVFVGVKNIYKMLYLEPQNDLYVNNYFLGRNHFVVRGI